jgi:hypothetical protein
VVAFAAAGFDVADPFFAIAFEADDLVAVAPGALAAPGFDVALGAAAPVALAVPGFEVADALTLVDFATPDLEVVDALDRYRACAMLYLVPHCSRIPLHEVDGNGGCVRDHCLVALTWLWQRYTFDALQMPFQYLLHPLSL